MEHNYRQYPEISHPYPPSYRSHLSSSQNTSSLPQANYQKRREDRYNSNQLSVNDNPYAADQPLYNSERPVTRLQRSESESSTHPVLSDELGKGYPTGWTKEDEEAEREFLSKGMIDWKKLSGWRFWIRKEWWYWYILAIVGVVLVILMSLYHDQIVDWMTPFANWMKKLPGGWAIPIGIFFVISFPPLFGHEILAVLVGAVWGLWIGFGITAAGTLLGEIGNFFAFEYCLRSRAEKHEKNNLNYACMAHVVRDGGFWMIFIIRLSAIPGHFSTAVFATCGTGFWVFTIACILTLPKQLIVVYLGVIFATDEDTKSSEKWISHSILIFGVLVTIWAAWYIWKKMKQARIQVWRKRRIEAASRGMILNEVRSKEWQQSNSNHLDRPTINADDEEATSPILHRHQHQSYQNPYDIRYESQDDMSIYHVDGINSNQSLGRKVEPEQDIGYAYKPSQLVDSFQSQPRHSQIQFPQAKSTGNQTNNLKRNQTTNTNYSINVNEQNSSEFPIPLPSSQVYGHVDHTKDHTRY
ncbi:uncharacterized protein I206_105033 [Kwoniella pini CBS 10737]|uniref:Golgi apparatus membrane protein TVP38 n=1 Tax=Kwoniella pini CBS 10737 TaxID=1296096 RepID=A0A1B9I8H6_9TREE|nr:uncharacterized protein I206_02573 [Kwoniella pini CBS 10737]OCF51857.1 hypothetical protein I206_02573 [Kwoniella pini CBS 10737]